MDKDIAPELIENVNKAFEKNCMKDGNMQAMARKLESGAASYEDAYKYAESVGSARAKAFKSEISSDVLPDGRMYYNIADRLMNDSLGTDHDMVADYAAKVQEIYNRNEGIGLKAQRADKDEDRIKGFIDRLDSEDNFDDVSWILNEPVKVHAMSVVDSTIKKNSEFHGKAGLKATVIRDAKSDCCGWCTDLAGDYVYPRVPSEVFARHDNCRCTLDYAGRRLSAYESGGKAHSFRDQGEQEKIEERKQISLKGVQRSRENDIIIANKDSVRSMNRARNINSIEDLTRVSDSVLLKHESVEEIQNYFREIHGISVKGFPSGNVFGVKATLAGIDDMMVAFPEIKSNIHTITYVSNMDAMGKWSSDGIVRISKKGLQDYGTGVHEASHALDYVRSPKGNSYSETIVEEARKSLGLRNNSREYKNQCIRITGDLNDAKVPAEVFAYAIETAKGGIRVDLADMIYQLIIRTKT